MFETGSLKRNPSAERHFEGSSKMPKVPLYGRNSHLHEAGFSSKNYVPQDNIPYTGSAGSNLAKLNGQVSNHVAFRKNCLANAANLSKEDVISALTKLSLYLEGQDLCLDEASAEDKQLYKMLEDKIEAFAGSYKPKELVDVACALAKLEIHSPKLFGSIAEQSRGKIMHFGTKELSGLAWAFAKSGNNFPDVFRAIAITSGIKMSGFHPHELSKLAWAFAIINLDDINKEFLGKLIKHIPTQSALYSSSDCMQIKQFHLYLTKIKGVDPKWEPSFQKKIDDEAAAVSAAGGHPSKLQLRVESAIAKTFPGGKIIREHIDPETAYSIDILLHVDGIHYAFEVDGPAHFVQLEGETMYNRTSQFKTDILSKHFTLIRIPYFDWEKLSTEEARKGYILKAMELNGYKPSDKAKEAQFSVVIDTVEVAGKVLQGSEQERLSEALAPVEVASRRPSVISNEEGSRLGGDEGVAVPEPAGEPVAMSEGETVAVENTKEAKVAEKVVLEELKVETKVNSFQSKVIMGLWIAASVGIAATAAYLAFHEDE